jgi:hypothetical protein
VGGIAILGVCIGAMVCIFRNDKPSGSENDLNKTDKFRKAEIVPVAPSPHEVTNVEPVTIISVTASETGESPKMASKDSVVPLKSNAAELSKANDASNRLGPYIAWGDSTAKGPGSSKPAAAAGLPPIASNYAVSGVRVCCHVVWRCFCVFTGCLASSRLSR